MTNSIFASKLIKVFFATSKGRFRCTILLYQWTFFFRNQLLVFLRICFYWAHLFHLMKLITCFSCASNRSRKWCVTHFYHCIWRYFQIPSCKGIYLSYKKTKQTSPPSVLCSPSWRSYPPFHHELSVKGTSTWFWDFNLSLFFFRFNFLQHNQLTLRWRPLLQCKNASRYQGIFNWGNLKKKTVQES